LFFMAARDNRRITPLPPRSNLLCNAASPVPAARRGD
jgi:hypothetical protein